MSEFQQYTKDQQEQEAPFDSKLIPVMREAVLTVQMVLYRTLKENMATRYADWPPEKQGRLAGAVVNNLFGTEALDPGVTEFAREHRELVEDELHGLHGNCENLVPFLTDALRMQAICDNQEGIHSLGCLLMARELGILREDRALPLPSTFMLSVRNLAAAHGIIEKVEAAPPPEDPPE
ncbi:MAG TPA: hypothetical protein ENK89_05035 [Desulfobulbaceae bacterium]|nr:hypothetical protein [Desulfobulbaceae bacterium]